MDPGERARLLARLSRLLHAGHIDADGEEAATARADLEAAVAEQQPARAVDALMLLIGRATGSGAPAVQRVCGALLAGCLARPGGVRALLEHLLGAAGEGDEEAFRRAARAIASPPPQAADPDVRPDPGPAPRAGAGAAEAYLGPVCGQLAELLAAEGSGRTLARGAAAAAHAVTARSPGRAQRLLVRPLLAPLLAEPAPGAEEEAERAAGGSLRALEALLARHAAPPTLFPLAGPAYPALLGLLADSEGRRGASRPAAPPARSSPPPSPPPTPTPLRPPRAAPAPRPAEALAWAGPGGGPAPTGFAAGPSGGAVPRRLPEGTKGAPPPARPLLRPLSAPQGGGAVGAARGGPRGAGGAEGVPPAVAAELFLAALAAAPRGPDEPVPCAPPSRRAPLAADAGAGAGRARRAPSRCSRRSPRRGPRGAGRLPPRPGRGAVGRAARLLAALLEREGAGRGGPRAPRPRPRGALLSGLVPGPGRPPPAPADRAALDALVPPLRALSLHPRPAPPRPPRPAPTRARSPDVAAAASAARAALAALRGPLGGPGARGPRRPGGELAEAIADLTRADAAPPERAAGAGPFAYLHAVRALGALAACCPAAALPPLAAATADPSRPFPLTEALVDAARRLGPLLTPHAACAVLALLEGTRDGDAGGAGEVLLALGHGAWPFYGTCSPPSSPSPPTRAPRRAAAVSAPSPPPSRPSAGRPSRGPRPRGGAGPGAGRPPRGARAGRPPRPRPRRRRPRRRPLTRSHAAAALAALADAVRAALGGQPALEIRMPGTAGPAARWRLGPTQLRG
eukprot:tig00001057_g6687.t1